MRVALSPNYLGMASKRSASVAFVFIAVLIDAMGIGIIIPVMPSLLQELTGAGIDVAARYNGWIAGAYAVMQFLCAPLLGVLSDRFGRRPVLLLAMLGLGIDFIFHALAPTVFWLFVSRVLAGVCGGSHTVANAYIADVSSEADRAKNFGLIGAAFGLGFILGPVIGGFAAELGTRAPFWVAACLSLANVLFGLLVLPESLPKEKRTAMDWKRANPLGAVLHLRKTPALLGLVVGFFLIYLAGYSVQVTWSFYTTYKFGWDEAAIGASLAVVGVVVALVQAVLVNKAVHTLGDRKTIQIGTAFWMLGLCLFAVASNGLMMYLFIIPYCLGGIAGPTLQSVMTRNVPATDQGKLQGALTSLMNLAAIIGMVGFSYVFALFTSDNAPVDFPGAAFAMGAFCVLLAILVMARPLVRLTQPKLS